MPDNSFSAVVVSEHGVTVVCRDDLVPAGAESSPGFKCLTVTGVFDLGSVGIVAAFTAPLASAGVSLFAYSTWETDYILIHSMDEDAAVAALIAAGHQVSGEFGGARPA